MTEQSSKEAVHFTLAQSYLVYFIFSMLGLFVDTFIGFNIHTHTATVLAIIFFGLGPALIVWAQYTSRHFAKEQAVVGAPYFHRGPYRFMRNPTHLGLLILVSGYTLVSGSLVFFSITVLGFLISNILFKKYESILHTEYGSEYGDYKNKVPKIL